MGKTSRLQNWYTALCLRMRHRPSACDCTDSEHLPYNVFGGMLNLTQSQSILIMDGKQRTYAHRFLSVWAEISLRLHQLSIRG